jgi:hypothetical protein
MMRAVSVYVTFIEYVHYYDHGYVVFISTEGDYSTSCRVSFDITLFANCFLHLTVYHERQKTDRRPGFLMPLD